MNRNKNTILMFNIVPSHPIVAAWLETATPEEIGLAVHIGMTGVNMMKTQVPSAPQPAIKGQQGEKSIFELLSSKYDVTNTTKTAHAGDISLFLNKKKFIVEVKNYDSTVPTTQVVKFQNDLSTSGAHGGVFLSLKSNIACMGQFTHRWEATDANGYVPCIYIANATPESVCLAVELVSAWCEYRKRIGDPVSDLLTSIEDQMSNIALLRAEMQQNLAASTAKTMKVYAGLSTIETTIRSSCNNIHPYMLGGAVDDIRRCAVFAKYNKAYQVVVNKILDNIGGQWTVNGKAYVNGKFTMYMDARSARIEVALIDLPDNWIVDNVHMLGKKVSITDVLTVVLDDSTVDLISKLI